MELATEKLAPQDTKQRIRCALHLNQLSLRTFRNTKPRLMLGTVPSALPTSAGAVGVYLVGGARERLRQAYLQRYIATF